MLAEHKEGELVNEHKEGELVDEHKEEETGGVSTYIVLKSTFNIDFTECKEERF